MKNPYEVLEIREGASEEEIKLAYKSLVKKYHPDRYVNNPLADLAEEKLKEVNEAYDYLMKGKGNTGYSNQNKQYSNNSFNEYSEIRRTIEMGNLNVAEEMLDKVMNRNAEWNYLKGVVLYRKGWYDQAYKYITVAVNLDPHNMEYRNFFNNINMGNSTYRQYGNRGEYNNNNEFCNICGSLLIADCCCECIGGDLITCC